jgi:hypothetical protein
MIIDHRERVHRNFFRPDPHCAADRLLQLDRGRTTEQARMKKGYYLSKSKVLSGWQCHRKLWLEVHDPDKAQVDESMERVFEIGHQVGELAQRMFPGGVLIGHDQDLGSALEETKQRMSEPGPVTLFEATFRHQGVLVRVDVLERDEHDRIRLIEVKAGTRVKPVNYIDCSVQAWVLTGLGIPPDWVELAHINNGFVYPGNDEYEGIVIFADVTDRVASALGSVPRWIDEYRQMLSAAEPDILIGPQCRNPYTCAFLPYCTPELPDYPVTTLPGGGKVIWELLADGIDDIRDIPEDRLTNPGQQWARRVTIEGKPDLNPAAAEELAVLGWPRYYFDFETVSFTVPIWEGTRPYQALPFQWSCHVQTEDGALEHREWLADGGAPPMRECAETLLKALGDSGPIFTYTKYELSVLTTLSAFYPDLSARLDAVIDRLYDLYPLTKANYYHPDMRGSWSIKAVLPTVAPDMDYNKLGEIREGMGASEAFLEIMDPGTSDDRREQLRSDLVQYCAYDTLAMVRVVKALGGAGP